MGAVDQDRYRSLIARAAFNAEFFRGTIQDLSAAQRVMTFVGSPRWSKLASWPCLKQNAANDGAVSAVVASIVDTTQAFWVELLIVPPFTASTLLLQFNAGGWRCYYDGTSQLLYLLTTTAVGGNARYCNSSVGSVPVRRPVHAVLGLDPVGLSGRIFLNGVPAVTAFVNNAPPVLCAAAILNVCGVGGESMRSMIARVWQGTPSNEDCQALYQQAKLLVGGEV
jgi:hypothetical protein